MGEDIERTGGAVPRELVDRSTARRHQCRERPDLGRRIVCPPQSSFLSGAVAVLRALFVSPGFVVRMPPKKARSDPSDIGRRSGCDMLDQPPKGDRRRAGLARRAHGDVGELYGLAHRRRRRELARIIDGGEGVCRRCGQPIIAGAAWDLGHVDGALTPVTSPSTAPATERQPTRVS
jgi:hypothetical protein